MYEKCVKEKLLGTKTESKKVLGIVVKNLKMFCNKVVKDEKLKVKSENENKNKKKTLMHNAQVFTHTKFTFVYT